jgi:hypothetical protein
VPEFWEFNEGIYENVKALRYFNKARRDFKEALSVFALTFQLFGQMLFHYNPLRDKDVVPSPCVHESLGLRSIFGSYIVVDLIVVAFGIKGWVDIAEINRLVTDKFPHQRQDCRRKRVYSYGCSGNNVARRIRQV